jgi:hypothetical protein
MSGAENARHRTIVGTTRHFRNPTCLQSIPEHLKTELKRNKINATDAFNMRYFNPSIIVVFFFLESNSLLVTLPSNPAFP